VSTIDVNPSHQVQRARGKKMWSGINLLGLRPIEIESEIEVN
jgi:hypothetical protein